MYKIHEVFIRYQGEHFEKAFRDFDEIFSTFAEADQFLTKYGEMKLAEIEEDNRKKYGRFCFRIPEFRKAEDWETNCDYILSNGGFFPSTGCFGKQWQYTIQQLEEN